jgi:hypothetical protein
MRMLKVRVIPIASGATLPARRATAVLSTRRTRPATTSSGNSVRCAARPPAPGVVSITSAAILAVAGRRPLGPMKKYWSLLNVG